MLLEVARKLSRFCKIARRSKVVGPKVVLEVVLENALDTLRPAASEPIPRRNPRPLRSRPRLAKEGLETRLESETKS